MKRLSNDELHNIEVGINTPTTEVLTTPINTNEISSDEIVKKENPKPVIDPKVQKLVDKYKVEILVKYKEELSKCLTGRKPLNKLRYCKLSRQKYRQQTL